MTTTEMKKVRKEYYENGNLRSEEFETKRLIQKAPKKRVDLLNKIKSVFGFLKTLLTIKELLLVMILFISQS